MSVRELTQFDFHHTLAETPGVSLVWFTATGCGACRQLERLFAEHAREFAALNLFRVDARQDMALTREFEVFHLPALFLFVDGSYYAPIHAEPLPASLLQAIDEALAGEPQEAP